MEKFEHNGKKELKKVIRKTRRLNWFPSYQSFSELGIKGLRNDGLRYKYLDFSLCRDKIVADYGCNIGQSSVKAAQAGAKKVIGMDSEPDTISAAISISNLLEISNIDYQIIDFNDSDFGFKIRELFKDGTPDISFFLSVYRTKELKDRDGLFKFIIDNTKEIIFFEGHSTRSIDTVEYYTNLFSKFQLKADFLGYSQKDTRPLFIIRMKK
jgi:SAM-dependent methyltransferase